MNRSAMNGGHQRDFNTERRIQGMKMQLLAIVAVAISIFGLIASFASRASGQKSDETTAGRAPAPMPDDLRAVSPALERYRESTLIGDLWKRTDLSQRDRCIVTLAALIAKSDNRDAHLFQPGTRQRRQTA
jgi:alkylhydroperoxidase/carboxymuconolactone decarboxylase family protein YurZ